MNSIGSIEFTKTTIKSITCSTPHSHQPVNMLLPGWKLTTEDFVCCSFPQTFPHVLSGKLPHNLAHPNPFPWAEHYTDSIIQTLRECERAVVHRLRSVELTCRYLRALTTRGNYLKLHVILRRELTRSSSRQQLNSRLDQFMLLAQSQCQRLEVDKKKKTRLSASLMLA